MTLRRGLARGRLRSMSKASHPSRPAGTVLWSRPGKRFGDGDVVEAGHGDAARDLDAQPAQRHQDRDGHQSFSARMALGRVARHRPQRLDRRRPGAPGGEVASATRMVDAGRGSKTSRTPTETVLHRGQRIRSRDDGDVGVPEAHQMVGRQTAAPRCRAAARRRPAGGGRSRPPGRHRC